MVEICKLCGENWGFCSFRKADIQLAKRLDKIIKLLEEINKSINLR